MTAQISAYGRLVVDVQSSTTSNGNTMSFTRMAVPLPCQKAEGRKRRSYFLAGGDGVWQTG